MTINQLGSFNSKSIDEINNWISYDFEWIVKDCNKSRLCKIDKNTSGASVPPATNEQDYSKIVTFGFEDNNGNKGCLDITDFTSAKLFLEVVKKKLLQYKYCFAWGSRAVVRDNTETGQLEGINGDLVVLDSNLKANGIPTIVGYDNYSHIPYFKRDIFTTTNQFLVSDIDLLQVFAKPLIRSILNNKYKGLRLDDVCRGVLGYGKLDNKTGVTLEKMSIEERKSYCLHDAHLVAELVKIKNGDIMKLMQIIAFHTGLKFEEVCHKGMTGIWKKILNEEISKKINLLGFSNLPSVLRKLYSSKLQLFENNDNYVHGDYEQDGGDNDEELLDYKENTYEQYVELLEQKERSRKLNSEFTDNIPYDGYSDNHEKNIIKVKQVLRKYKGGLIIPPLRGLHYDVLVFDITSLYPTMIINHNLSPETVNCSCCRNNPKAKLNFDTEFVNDFLHNKNNCGGYWICLRRKGLFSNKLKELTQIRIQYKKQGKDLESSAIKAIINSGYGVFGHSNFKYYDPAVAELVTALGRQTIKEMQQIAKELSFKVLYGDTDSLFVNEANDKDDIAIFIDRCKQKLNVEVNHEKTFKKLILVSKKHYIGFFCDGINEPIIKGMEGMKSDRPEFIQTAFREMVEDINNDTNPIPRLKHRFEELDKRQVPKERLAISLVLAKNPKDYTHDDKQKRLGNKLGLKKGDSLTYYKCDKEEIIIAPFGKKRTRIVSESDSPDDISYSKYREMLLNSIKDVIDILGHNVRKDLLPNETWIDMWANYG